MFVLCSYLCCSVELFVAVLWLLFVGSVFVCAVLFWFFVYLFLSVFVGNVVHALLFHYILMRVRHLSLNCKPASVSVEPYEAVILTGFQKRSISNGECKSTL